MLPDQYKGDFTLLSSEDADSVELGQWSASEPEKQPNIAKQHALEPSDVADAAAEAADLKLRVLCGLSLLIQMTVSQSSGSLAMLSDSFHNLSDVASLFLALYVHRLQKRRFATARLPYGYKRAEVLGGLVNGVALIALCIYVTLSAIPEILAPEELDASWLFIIIAGSGVPVNLMGVLMFSGNSVTSSSSNSSSDSKHAHCSTAAVAADGVELCSAVPHQQRSHEHSHNHEHATVTAPSHCCSGKQQQQQQQQQHHSGHCSGSSDSEEAADLNALINLLSGSSIDDVSDVPSCTVFGAGAPAATASADRSSSCCSSVQTSSTASSVSDEAAVTPKCVTAKHTTAHSASTAATSAAAANDEHDRDNDSDCETDTPQPWYAHSHSHHHHHTSGSSGCSHSHSGCSSSSGSGGSLNLWAVFVHSAMDALASGVICLGALVMRFAGAPGQQVSG
jgi:Co/Zn/Cd efflux system component